MLDPKFVREHESEVRQTLSNCGSTVDLSLYLDLERRRRDLTTSVEKRKSRKNKASEEISKLKREGQDVSAWLPKLQELSEEIKGMENEIAAVESDFRKLELTLCNLPHPSVPIGRDESANQIIRHWGTPPTLSFQPKTHTELGDRLSILSLERASKMSGSRFAVLTGLGAQLERALMNFMIDTHLANNYIEVTVPHLVTAESMEASGQFPKFIDQAFAIEKDQLFLIPTAEVPLTNLHRNEVLSKNLLPRKYVAYSPCYRREAGSYGQETKGLIRLHQFDKVELYQLVEPEKSFEALESLTQDAERILQALELPYRVTLLCTGDKSFASSKTYDLEVWLPSQNSYREISSCSNCTDFQARRANIRYRQEAASKPNYVHTLNGSGLAIGRTWLAILENFQQKDGSIVIPRALRPYCHGLEILKAPTL
jgi:seryl-tRNA synthetase